MRPWALGLVLAVALPAAAQPWATATPRPTPRPTYPPAPTRTVAPAPTAVAATRTPTPRSTPAATPVPGACAVQYVFPVSAPIIRPAVGQPLRYADGTPFTILVRLASGEILCTVVRAE